ncbi:MAG: hypothetical protein GY854_01990, partial [Deltaproteobacteria bacterium]|nr:hypothetical protein [Deltaproteobacteria bacterium]
MSTLPQDHTDKLARHYRVLVDAMCEISQAYLYHARLGDALELLNPDVLELVGKDLSPEDKVRLQVQRAKILRYKGYCDYDNDLYDAALDVLFEAEKSVREQALLADVVDLIGLTLHSKESRSDATLEMRLGYLTRGLALR